MKIGTTSVFGCNVILKSVCVSLLLIISGKMLAQSAAREAFKELRNIPYYTGNDVDTSNHKLNLVVPVEVKQSPLLIWIGGGAWSYVNRHMEMDFARKIAREGIAVASVGHRLSPATWKDPTLNKGIRHPEHVKDIARAIAFLYANAEKCGYSKDKIFIGGYSSGGHLTALVTMDDRYLKAEGLSPQIIKGIIPMAGTYHIEHYHQVLADGNSKAFADNHVGSVFGLTAEDFKDSSPSTYMDNLLTPMFLVSETNTFKYANLFEDMLRAKNVQQLEVLHIHRLNHGQLWKEISYAEKSIYREMMIDFIRRNATAQTPKQ